MGIFNGDLIKVELVHFTGKLVITVGISFLVILFVQKIWITTADMNNFANFLRDSMKAVLEHFKAKRFSVGDLPSKEGFIDLDIFTTSFDQLKNLEIYSFWLDLPPGVFDLDRSNRRWCP